ncbi:hypothetical protein SEA_ZION_58 [Corynebacterium phage Zion]|nr:hypothetical protein FDJ12_gp86 [Corynebacterium phage Zion]YP_010103254.1 hypothetical protein KNU65_gp84 [Corynebacterium phage Stickynote]ATW58692.1 hypothetical protein SEA_POTATOCHIP_58 [Corynebacterium phage PotatoChip]AYR03357.1 hypothetical protein PETEYPAB_57 [Corynebacterium phage PeteyPab]ATW58846.1 hypothetical protein SEA_ZION_58 [Corynebacterium phage Zion]QDF19251.1 hypothetical protein SEA_STICKYNOTE_58 [Corynebacterium phage Stickynote]
MPSTIEVPISLIKAGDMDAIRELLPKPNLFGRWATHPGELEPVALALLAIDKHTRSKHERHI